MLYKYGPYSFELTDELTALRADSILTLDVSDPKYGPRYVPIDKMRSFLQKRFPKTVSRHKKQVEFVAGKLGGKGVADLECLATALYVRLKGNKESPPARGRAAKIVKLKPRISEADAECAVREAVENGKITAQRLASFHKILEEALES